MDFVDFLSLSANFGTEGASYTEGNIDLDGAVDFVDFLFLSASFGQSAAAQPVPEPTGFMLLALATLCIGTVRRSAR